MFRLVILLAAYAIAPVVAGHGVAVKGIVLFVPLWPTALAWGAIVVGFAGSLRLQEGSIGQLLSSLLCAALLYGAWIANVLEFKEGNDPVEKAAAVNSMIWLSLPFQLATVWVVVRVIVLIRRARKQGRG